MSCKSFKYLYFLFIFLPNLLFIQTSSAVFIQKIGTEDGLPQSSVRDIVQDKTGFIWIATEAGLARYDGYEMKIYRGGSEPNQLPNDRIHDLSIDLQGRLWLGTDQGVYLYNQLSDDFSPLTISNTLSIVPPTTSIQYVTSTKESLWFNSFGQLYEYNFTTKKLIQKVLPNFGIGNGLFSLVYDKKYETLMVLMGQASYSIDNKNHHLTPILNEKTNEKIILKTAVYLNNGDLSFYSNKKFWCSHKTTKFLFHCGSAPNLGLFDNMRLTSMFQHENGSFWVGTLSNGLFQLDSKFNILNQYKSNSIGNTSLTNNDIIKIFVDREHNIWLALTGGGVNKISNTSLKFDLFQKTNNSQFDLSHNHVKSFLETDDGTMWIGTFNGLSEFNPINHQFRSYQLKGKIGELQPQNFIKDIVAINKTELMLAISTPHKGTSFWRFNIVEKSWKAITAPGQIGEVGGFKFLPIEDKILVVLTGKGLAYYDPIHDTWEKPTWFKVPKEGIHIGQLYLDKDQNLWLGTMHHGAFKYNFTLKKLSQYKQQPQDNSLTGNWVKSFLHDNNNNMWIGTTQGLNKIINGTDKVIKVALPKHLDQTIYSILQDKKEFIWSSTNKGIIRFHPDLIETQLENVQSFHTQQGIQGDEFNTGAYYKDSNGQLYFGGTKGFNSFNPLDFTSEALEAETTLTGFSILNKLVQPKVLQNDYYLPSQIHLLDRISLSYKHFIFSIRFSSLSFDRSDRTKYSYRLLGLSDDWLETDHTSRKVTFTGLDPGDYQLQVRSLLSNGLWEDSAKTLSIFISPPWWKTYWAYSLYISLLIALPFYYFQRKNRLFKLRAEELKETVKQRTFQLEQALIEKEQVFTNISHEFRTPLTLMIGPANELDTNEKSTEIRLIGNTIKRNGLHLLRLVDQLLGINKAAEKNINLSPLNLNLLITAICERFFSYSKIQNISLDYSLSGTPFITADPEDVEKIISNLLSNAFKYSSCGDSITVSSQPVGDQIKISVQDTGLGINESEIDKIFERFYRSNNTDDKIQGSGIGLFLVKELLNKTNGTISLESQPNKGSTFTISWPMISNSNIAEYQLKEEERPFKTLYTKQELATLEEPFYQEVQDSKQTGLPTILIVEDHIELRKYLYKLLSKHYSCATAEDGEKGVALAIRHQPKLIISDIMMPKMDGYALCAQLKQDHRTSHIPIILLTAKADQQSRIKGLIKEANLYLSKPFDFDELCLHIKNLLTERENLKKLFCLALDNEHHIDNRLPDEDQIFLKLLNEHIAKNYQDTSFLPKSLAILLNMSERQLQRKFKDVAGITPSQFLRRWRLNKSRQFILEGNPIGNVAFDVGFSNQAYFGKCFKEEFNATPSEYFELHKNLNSNDK